MFASPHGQVLHASSGLLLYSLHESIQRPWDVGSLLVEDHRFSLELTLNESSKENA